MKSFAIQVTLQDSASIHQEGCCYDNVINASAKLENLVDRHGDSQIMKISTSTTKQIANDVLAISDDNIMWQKSEDEQHPDHLSINHPISNSGNPMII